MSDQHGLIRRGDVWLTRNGGIKWIVSLIDFGVLWYGWVCSNNYSFSKKDLLIRLEKVFREICFYGIVWLNWERYIGKKIFHQIVWKHKRNKRVKDMYCYFSLEYKWPCSIFDIVVAMDTFVSRYSSSTISRNRVPIQFTFAFASTRNNRSARDVAAAADTNRPWLLVITGYKNHLA